MFSRRPVQLVLLGLLIALGCWAYLPALNDLPMGADAEKWISRTHPGADDRWAYVLSTRHFVGYRPTTALSFALNGSITGWSVAGYRIVDLALHGLTAVGLWALYRRLSGDKSPLSLLAPALYLLHPAAEAVVPHVARRSYLLASVAGCWGAVAWLKAYDTSHRGFLALSIGALLCAVGANEVAVVTALCLPLMALTRPVRRWRWLAGGTAALAVAGAALTLRRLAVMGRVGGYHKHYFVDILDGEPVLHLSSMPERRAVLDGALGYLFTPTAPNGEAAPFGLPVPVLWVTVVVALLGTAWLIRDRRTQLSNTPVLAVAWLAGLMALYAWSGNWFWRMGQPLTLPTALLIPAVARICWTHPARQVRWGGAFITAVVSLSIGWHASAWTGLSESARSKRVRTMAVWRAIEPSLQAMGSDDLVWLALPLSGGNARVIVRWRNRLHPDGPRAALLVHRAFEEGEPGADIFGFDHGMLTAAPGYKVADGTPRLNRALDQAPRTHLLWFDTDQVRSHPLMGPDIPALPAAGSSPH
jgi:hypothetical protein